MKLKTSVTLSEDILKMINKRMGRGESRSEVVERLLRKAIANEEQIAKDARDLELLNNHAEELNQEAEDVLAFQVEF